MICLYIYSVKFNLLFSRVFIIIVIVVVVVVVVVLLSYSHLFENQPIALVGRVFANDPGDLGSIPGRVIPKI